MTETLSPRHATLARLPTPGTIFAFLKRLGPAGVVTAFASFLPGMTGTLVLVFLQQIGEWLKSQGTAGVFIAMGAFTLLGGFMLAPTYSFSALCGWSFGVRVGLFAAMGAIMAAGLLNYAWAKVVCQDRVITILEENPKARAIYVSLLRSSRLKTLGVVTLLRLPPTSPFALTNVLLAATKVPFMTVVAGTLVGMLPRTLIVVVASAGLSRLDAEAKQNPVTWVIAILLTVLALASLGWLGRRALEQATSSGGPDIVPKTQTPAV